MIKVLQWNCRGLRGRAAELKARYVDRPSERSDILLLQETNTTNIVLQGYESYSSPSIPGRANGHLVDPPGMAMVYVRQDWHRHQINTTKFCTENQEVVAIRVSYQLQNLVVVSAYYRPRRGGGTPRDYGWVAYLHNLYPRDHKLYAGDFNAQHTLWGYASSGGGAEKLIEEMSNYQMHLTNKKGIKTRIGGAGQKDTTPDLTWVANPYIQHHKWKCLPDNWGSDHFPITFQFSLTRKARDGPAQKRQVKTIYWDKFRQTLKDETMEAAPLDLRLRCAIEKATIKTKVDEDAPTPDLGLLQLWAHRLRAVQTYRKGPRTPIKRRNITRATVEAKVYAQKLGLQRWLDYSSTLSEKTSVARLWATSRSMLGKKRTKAATGTLALKMGKTEEELTVMAGDLFFPQPAADSSDYDSYAQEVLAPDSNLDRPFTRGELESALHSGKANTAPGPDQVTTNMLRNLPDHIGQELLCQINQIWETGQLPQDWKHSAVIPIPKPGKDKGDLANYRPISLTSCTCKVMERMVLRRIEWLLETTGAFHSVQTGFRPGLSTQESLTLISAGVITTATRQAVRAIVTVDVKKAFDSVPHAAVIREAQQLGLGGRPLNFIRAFLAGRTYSVQCGSSHSEPRANRVGVPQGSVLSPMLFNIVMAALPHELDKVPQLGFTIYADDISIWTRESSLSQQQDTLQAGLDTIENHLRRVGLQASPEKTSFVVLAPKRLREAKISDAFNLVLAGKRIVAAPSVKILGLLIDETGGADLWLRQTIKQCNSALNVIRRICSAQGGATEEVARRMVKALVVSRVCYGATHCRLTKAQWKRLETLNHQAMRVITGLPAYTALPRLKEKAQLNSLYDTVHARSRAHWDRLKHSRQGREILCRLGSKQEDWPALPEQLPPWEDLLDIVEHKPLGKLRKGDTQKQERLVKAHNKMVGSWTNPSTILAAYTDFALGNDGPGAAVACFPEIQVDASTQLPTSMTVRGGELAAIQVALESVLANSTTRPKELHIFSDSKEAVTECKKANSPCRRVRKIKKIAARLLLEGTKTIISWVPGHAGIQGNEKAHQLARVAVISLREQSAMPSHQLDHGYSIACNQAQESADENNYDPGEEKLRIKEQYKHRLWESLPPDPDPLPGGLGRRGRVILTRIQANANPTPARIARWGKGRSGTCVKCNGTAKADTVHLLWNCPYYKDLRTKHKPTNITSLEEWVRPPPRPPDNVNILKSLLDFIFEAKLDVHM